MSVLTAEELLAGSSIHHEVAVPTALVNAEGLGTIQLRPLTVRDLQKIRKASNGDENLSAALMIQHALVEPELKIDQVIKLPAGLARFLVEKINELSGVDTPRSELQDMVQAPLARACFILAKEFGWSPEDVSGMTIGQILLYLEMVQEGTVAVQ